MVWDRHAIVQGVGPGPTGRGGWQPRLRKTLASAWTPRVVVSGGHPSGTVRGPRSVTCAVHACPGGAQVASDGLANDVVGNDRAARHVACTTSQDARAAAVSVRDRN